MRYRARRRALTSSKPLTEGLPETPQQRTLSCGSPAVNPMRGRETLAQRDTLSFSFNPVLTAYYAELWPRGTRFDRRKPASAAEYRPQQ